MAEQKHYDGLSTMLDKDVEKIAGRGCTPRVQRLRNQYFANTPTLTSERVVSITKIFKETENEPLVIRKAKALYDYCENKTVDIQQDELVVGNQSPKAREVNIYPETSINIEKNLDTVSTRAQDAYLLSEENKAILREMFPYWKGRTMNDYCRGHMPPEVSRLAVGTDIIDAEIKQAYAYGHSHLGLGNILLKKGFKGIEDTAKKSMNIFSWEKPEDHEKIEQLEAALISCKAIKLLAERYAAKAREIAENEKDEKRKKELIVIAETCEWVPYNVPRTFREAIQAVWFTQIGAMMEQSGPAMGLGRFDQYMYPFYKKDLEKGIINKDEALELIECLWIKQAENIQMHDDWTSTYFGGYQYFLAANMGGIDGKGRDAVNEITYMMIEATNDIRLHSPSLVARWNRKNPMKYFEKITELIKTGIGYPQIHNDEVGIQQMLALGTSVEDAYNYEVEGCSESLIAGKMWKYSDAGQVNMPCAIDFVFNNGYSKMRPSDKPWGIQTGDPNSFKTYDEFYDAVKIQIEYLTKMLCIANMTTERAHIARQMYPYSSCLYEGCLERGLDFAQGGAIYQVGPAPSFVGLADLANSLASIKKFVYDEKVMTMQEIVDVCNTNFEGHEDIRMMFLNKAPKYGTDNSYVDDIARDIADFCATIPPKYYSFRGVPFTDAMFPVAANTPLGKAVGALPSGRIAGVPIADGVSPQQGTDHSPTEVIKSVASYDHTRHVNGNLLNMKFTPKAIEGELGTRRFINLIKSFFDMGGWHIQLNCVDAETLKMAQAKPKEYPDLMIRVAGYSAYFNDLCRETQDEIISRTTHEHI